MADDPPIPPRPPRAGREFRRAASEPPAQDRDFFPGRRAASLEPEGFTPPPRVRVGPMRGQPIRPLSPDRSQRLFDHVTARFPAADPLHELQDGERRPLDTHVQGEVGEFLAMDFTRHPRSGGQPPEPVVDLNDIRMNMTGVDFFAGETPHQVKLHLGQSAPGAYAAEIRRRDEMGDRFGRAWHEAPSQRRRLPLSEQAEGPLPATLAPPRQPPPPSSAYGDDAEEHYDRVQELREQAAEATAVHVGRHMRFPIPSDQYGPVQERLQGDGLVDMEAAYALPVTTSTVHERLDTFATRPRARRNTVIEEDYIPSDSDDDW